jgi:hypothetical protein
MGRREAGVFCLVLFLAAGSVGAQAFHLQSGTLSAGGVQVAEVSQIPVSVSWVSSLHARVTFEDEALKVSGSIYMRSSEDFLMAGVGDEVLLEGTKGWRIRMLPGTWAPVMSGKKKGVRIALPEKFPIDRAFLPAGSSPAPSPPEFSPWSYDEGYSIETSGGLVEDDELLGQLCTDRLYRKKGGKAFWKGLDSNADFLSAPIEKDGVWLKVRAYVSGFEVEGWIRAEPCQPAPFSSYGFGATSSCGDGFSSGPRVSLGEGTAFYASPKTPAKSFFAVVKKNIEALELDHDFSCNPCFGLTDASLPENDPQKPPERGFVVEHEAGEGKIVLFGYIKIPLGELKIIEEGNPFPGGGFGMCRSQPESWPQG